MEKKSSTLSFYVSILLFLALVMPLQTVQAAPPATIVYDAIPNPLPPNMASQPFQAQQTFEFGDYVHLAGTNRLLRTITVTMSNWALYSDYSSDIRYLGNSVTWTHPITVNVYSNHISVNGVPDTLLGTVTQMSTIPWRPVADPTCLTPTAWRFDATHCYNGFAFNITFDMSSLNVTLPDDIIVGIAYNTETYGATPIGVTGPYNSLNVGVVGSATVGTDDNIDNVFWNTSTAAWYTDGGVGGVGIFREDTGWTSYGTMPIQITAAPIPPDCTGTSDCYVDAVNGNDVNGGASIADAKKTIQAGVDAVGAGGTVHVLPGDYSETALNRSVLGVNGPHQFGLFVDKDGVTIQGVTAGDIAITDFNALGAYVITNATNNFGASGIFVQGDDVTIAGLHIGPNIPGDNKTIEIIGDGFTLKDSHVDVPGGGSVYFNDWQFDTINDVSHVQSYTLDHNLIDQSTSVDIASGAGYSGLVSGRQIKNNKFVNADYWPSISFNGSGTGVEWFIQSVGGAVIEDNTFTNTYNGTEVRAGHIRVRGNVDVSQFDWTAYWNDNTFNKAVVILDGAYPPFNVRQYNYTSGTYSFDVRRIGVNIQGSVDKAVAGDTVLVKAGTYAENITIPKSLTLKGAQYDVNVSGRTAASISESTIQGLVTVNSSDVNINGFTLTNPGQTYALSITPISSNIAVTYNMVDTVGAVGLAQNVHAIMFQNGADSVTIANNSFNNIKASTKSVSAIGVLDSASTNTSTGLLIQGNIFTDIASASSGAYGVIFNNGAGVPGAQIKDNTFSGLSGKWTHAIGLEGPTPNAIVTGNIFSDLTAAGADNAAILFEKNPVGGTVTVSQNQFNGTAFYGVAVHPNDLPGGANGLNYTVIAESNWWDSASGPGIVGPGTGTLVGPNVDFTPWLCDGTDTDPAIGFQPNLTTSPCADQTITFAALSNKSVGDPDFTVSATASSGLTVTFTVGVSDQCTISGDTVHLTGAGSCTVTAHQAGNASFNAAPDVDQTFSIGKLDPIITWANPADIVYGTTLTGTQLNANASVPGSFAYTPAAGTILNAGASQVLHVDFTPTDTANYNIASLNVTINVLKAPLTITADNKSKFSGSANPTLTASYSGFVNGDTPASLDTPVTLTTTATTASPAGIYPITASGATDANYTIMFVNGTLTVIQANPKIAVDKKAPNIGVGGGSVTYTYSVTNPGNVPLSTVTVSDDKCSVGSSHTGDSNGNTLLDPGETWTYTCTYTPSFTSYKLTNKVTVKGTYATTTYTATDSKTLYPFTLKKKMYLYWDESLSRYDENYSVTYLPADNTLFTVEVYKDNVLLGTYTVSQNSPQKLWLGYGSYTFKEVNLPAGYLAADSSFTYTTSNGTCFHISNRDHQRHDDDKNPTERTFANIITYNLAIDKTGPATAHKGATITYNYTVTNSGPASVKPKVTDDKCSYVTYVSGDTNHDGRINPGETWNFKCTYKVTSSIGSKITNKATVFDVDQPRSWDIGGDTDATNNKDTWTLTVIK